MELFEYEQSSRYRRLRYPSRYDPWKLGALGSVLARSGMLEAIVVGGVVPSLPSDEPFVLVWDLTRMRQAQESLGGSVLAVCVNLMAHVMGSFDGYDAVGAKSYLTCRGLMWEPTGTPDDAGFDDAVLGLIVATLLDRRVSAIGLPSEAAVVSEGERFRSATAELRVELERWSGMVERLEAADPEDPAVRSNLTTIRHMRDRVAAELAAVGARDGEVA